MRLVILANQRSGRGRASALSRRFAAQLRSDGHTVRLLPLPRPHAADHGSAPPLDPLHASLAGAAALIAAGGDGTVHAAAMAAARTGTPLYHLPCGNENLFAREFGMTAGIAPLRRALSRYRIARADIAQLTDSTGQTRHFTLMCGLGIDAAVVHRLAATPRRPIGHLAYLIPMFQEFLHPRFPSLTIHADGQPIIEQQRGLLSVANSRQYALRLDPAPEASMLDGLLDIVFIPCTTLRQALRWALAHRLRPHARQASVIHARASSVRIVAHDGPAPYQIDGEAPPPSPASRMLPTTPLTIQVEPARLAVLLP